MRRGRPRAGGAGDRLGEVGRVLGGDRGPPRRGRRADAGDLAAAVAHARPGGGGGAGGAAGGDAQLLERRGLGAGGGRPAGRRAGRGAGVARAAREPRVRRAGAGRRRRAARAAGDRRGARDLGLGPRLPAGLPAHRRDRGAARPGHPSAGDHGDGERARHRRRRRPAGDGHAGAARPAGPEQPAAGGDRRAVAARAVRVGGGAPAGAAGVGDRLHAHEGRRGAPDRGDRRPPRRRRARRVVHGRHPGPGGARGGAARRTG